MIHIGRRSYPYMEEINEGILRQFDWIRPKGGRVLDVGCGRGALSDAIRKAGWEVWGIEQNADACTTARGRLNRLLEADLLDFKITEQQLGETRFDCLIFSDVLEHLYDPRGVLENYLQYVKPGGKVLVSVPNAVVWTNRILWTIGRVGYTDTGVMDRTHVRFFTFRSAQQLVQAAGCHVVRKDFTPYLARAALSAAKRWVGSNLPNPRALIDSSGYKFYMRYAYPLERLIAGLWKGMFAFRIIVVAIKP